MAVVSVRDQGNGIEPEVYPRLFQKFAASQEYGATGLGLYISKSIVEAPGGMIWAENNGEVRRGATFTFTVPVLTKAPND
jgi:signal transduction histidine kinase